MSDFILDREDACPMDSITDLLNRKWAIPIIKDMFIGRKYFNEFKKGKPKMSNVVLNDTLKYLETKGIVGKKFLDDKTPRKTEYYLTEKGKMMNHLLYEIVYYGLFVLEDDLRTD